MHILLIDNYDSFTYNLYQSLASFGLPVCVRYNDAVRPEDLCHAAALVISPGPGRPQSAGQCIDIIRKHHARIPMLGVCLGHQCIAEAFGSEISSAQRIMHGKTSQLIHDERTIYSGLPNPTPVGRYHSLIVTDETLPDVFEIASYTREGEVMGIRHRELPIEGVQFHPESILTAHGDQILRRFTDMISTNTMKKESQYATHA